MNRRTFTKLLGAGAAAASTIPAAPARKLHIGHTGITWGAFGVAALTGALMFITNARVYATNTPFLIKMGLLVLAGINMAIFHFFTWRGVHRWDLGCEVPLAGKVAAGLSLVFWILVVCFGRKIGFVLGVYE